MRPLSDTQRARIEALPVARCYLFGILAEILTPRVRPDIVDWAENNILLDAKITAEPGRWRSDRTPYLREILKAFADPDVTEIDFCAGTQVGKTTAEMIMLGFAADQDPGPALFIQPTRDLAGEFSDERVLPMFRDSPALSPHLPPSSRYTTRFRYRLDRMDIHFAWAGSASKLASKPKRYLFFDEVDKYPAFTGKEADPISLGLERQRTFWNRKAVFTSTPTVHDGNIWKRLERSSFERYHLPCPHCGHYQHLEFGNIRFNKEDGAARIKDERSARYICCNCEGEITDGDKVNMLQVGVWCPKGCTVDKSGAIIGERTIRSVRGFHINSLYSPWLTFSEIAAMFLDSKDETSALQNFVNSWLGEPFYQETSRIEDGRMDDIKGPYQRGTFPDSDVVLVCGVDKQQGHLWWRVDAFAENEESWRVDWGRCDCVIDDDGRLMADEFDCFEGTVIRREWGAPLIGIFMDSKYDGDRVFSFARKHRPLVVPVQGADRDLPAPVVEIRWDPKGKGKNVRHGMSYLRVDTKWFKDKAAALYANDDPGFWVPDDVDTVFISQFLSEHKVTTRTMKNGRPQDRWEKRPNAKDNHLWDCGVYILAGAHYKGVGRGPLPGKRAHSADRWFNQLSQAQSRLRRR